MAKFISDEDMEKLQPTSKSAKFISDDDMDKIQKTSAFDSKRDIASENEVPADDGILQTLADTGRSAVQGVTGGFSDELTGGVEALWEKTKGNPEEFGKLYAASRDSSRKKNKEAEERSPVASTIGNIAGSLAPALLTAGATAPAAGAGLLARIGNAAKIGAGAGAIGGLGTSEADLTKGDVLGAGGDVLSGAVAGGVTGGVFQGGIEGVKGLAKGIKGTGKLVGKTQLAKDVKESYKLGNEGEDLVTSSGLDKAEVNIREKTKDTAFGLREAQKSAGAAIGEAKKLAKEQGFTVDTKEGVEKLKKFIANAQHSIDPRERQDAKVFQELIDNLEKGVAKEELIQSSGITLGKPIKPKLSSEEKLLEKISTERESERLVTPNKMKERDIIKSTDEDGRDLISVLRSATDKETGEVVPVSAKSIIDKEGVAAGYTPNERGPLITNKEMVRSGGSDISNLSVDEADKFKRVLNTQNGIIGSPDLKTTEALNLAKQVAGGFDSSMREFAPLANANDKFSAISQAFDTLGIDPKTAFIKNPATKQAKLTIQAEQQLNNTIKRMARDTDAGENASVKLNEALKLLEFADPTIANKLKPQIERASKVLDLAQKAQRLGLLNKSTYLKSGTVAGANILGQGVGAVKTSLSNATPEYLKQVGQALLLKGPNGMKAASVLSDVIKRTQKDNVGRNAALFAMQQDPNYRNMLKDYFTNEDDDKK